MTERRMKSPTTSGDVERMNGPREGVEGEGKWLNGDWVGK